VFSVTYFIEHAFEEETRPSTIHEIDRRKRISGIADVTFLAALRAIDRKPEFRIMLNFFFKAKISSSLRASIISSLVFEEIDNTPTYTIFWMQRR